MRFFVLAITSHGRGLLYTTIIRQRATVVRQIETGETTMVTRTKTTSSFLIGKDSRGRWVAQKQHGLTGGLFVTYAAALKFALFENGNRPEAVVTVPGTFELDLGGHALAA
jgi:hypothetical protein